MKKSHPQQSPLIFRHFSWELTNPKKMNELKHHLIQYKSDYHKKSRQIFGLLYFCADNGTC